MASETPSHNRVRLPGDQRVDIGKAKVAAAIGTVRCLFLRFDNREGRIDIADIVAAPGRVSRIKDAMEDEIERI